MNYQIHHGDLSMTGRRTTFMNNPTNSSMAGEILQLNRSPSQPNYDFNLGKSNGNAGDA